MKLGWCPSHSIRFLFFIHELIKLFPSHAAEQEGPTASRLEAGPYPPRSRRREEVAWVPLGEGLPPRQGCQLFSPRSLDPSSARGHQSPLYPNSSQGSAPGLELSVGLLTTSFILFEGPLMPEQHLKFHVPHADLLPCPRSSSCSPALRCCHHPLAA